MSKRGENIYKRKDGRWEGRYIRHYDHNKKPKFGYIYGKTYNEVKRKLIEIKGNAPDITTLVIPNMLYSYSMLLDEWLRSVKMQVKESTYACYTRLINSHIRPQLGEYRLSILTTQIIEQFIIEKLNTGSLIENKGLSAKTVSDILVVVKSSLEYARYHDYEVCCNLSRLTVKRPKREIRVFNHEEQNTLVNTLINDMDLYKFGVLLSLYTGIRIGELCSLQWDDFSACGSVLKVRKTLQRIQNTDMNAETKTKVIITEPKSQCSKREIPIPPFLVEYVTDFRGASTAYVLSGRTDKYIEPRTMQNHFKKYMKESGIEEAGFHTLRHTFATRCIEVGFEVKSLSEILGHANVNITLNRYVHSSFALKTSNMNKLTLEI